MSAFGGLILTNKGRNLQAKVQIGATLHYTRVGVGDGTLGASQIVELTALKNQVLTLPITKLKVQSASRALIGTVLKNSDLSSGFYFREIGVFAQDPDLGEILYCYGNAGALADYIPSSGGPDIIEKAIDLQVLTGNAQNVTATIDQSLVYLTVKEKGANHGVAPLDENGKIPTKHIDIDLSNIEQSVQVVDKRVTQHLADIATTTKVGHTKGGGNITVGADGTLNTRTATTAQTGVVQLNSTLTSTSTTQAATASTVKSLNENKANKSDVDAHVANLVQHNQFMDGSVKVQVILGWNKSLNCPTMEYVEVV